MFTLCNKLLYLLYKKKYMGNCKGCGGGSKTSKPSAWPKTVKVKTSTPKPKR